jgi:two-component sensor histidine kinase
MQLLVIRPVAALRRAMRSFADRRQIPVTPELRDSAAELRDIDRTFHRMAEKITRDEADVENQLYEREVLLREVHHRVKNNLQLMSSIMNMQMRRSNSPEVRAAIRNLQDRLSSLAMVHRTLYQSSDVAQVRADALIEDVARELMALAGSQSKSSVKLLFDLSPVTLEPDQAGPLALLTAEAVTNALKYVEPDEAGDCWLTVALGRDTDEDDRLVLAIENSAATDARMASEEGLGARLIRAFASQLEAGVEQEAAEGRYRVRVRFSAASERQ